MIRYFSLLLLVLSFSSAAAQQPPLPPGAFNKPEKHVDYKDSVQFKAAFAEFYPLIKPTPNVRERAEAMLNHMGQQFRARGIDSAKAYDTAMKAIDPNLDQKILFDAYRKEFSAEELKSLIAFFKSPVGKHYVEVEGTLFEARNGRIQQEIARRVYGAIMPMMTKANNERMKVNTEPLPLSPAPKPQKP